MKAVKRIAAWMIIIAFSVAFIAATYMFHGLHGLLILLIATIITCLVAWALVEVLDQNQ